MLQKKACDDLTSKVLLRRVSNLSLSSSPSPSSPPYHHQNNHNQDDDEEEAYLLLRTPPRTTTTTNNKINTKQKRRRRPINNNHSIVSPAAAAAAALYSPFIITSPKSVYYDDRLEYIHNTTANNSKKRVKLSSQSQSIPNSLLLPTMNMNDVNNDDDNAPTFHIGISNDNDNDTKQQQQQQQQQMVTAMPILPRFLPRPRIPSSTSTSSLRRYRRNRGGPSQQANYHDNDISNSNCLSLLSSGHSLSTLE